MATLSSPNIDINELIKIANGESFQQWTKQTRLFARYFLANVKLPVDLPFSLLDVGCGNGAALSEIFAKNKCGELYGCDIDPFHIALAQYINPAIPKERFYVSGLDDIKNRYDFIYASNILEHIVNWKECLAQLCTKANAVIVMVPYKEDLSEQTPSAVPYVDHVDSFDRKSLDYLMKQGFDIKTRVIRTPYAWGGPLRRDLVEKIRQKMKGRSFMIRKEIIFLITHSNCKSVNQEQISFRNRIGSCIRSIAIARNAKRGDS